MKKTYNVAVIGATGSVGREVLSVLSERSFPVNKIFAVASKASIGKKVSFGEEDILEVTSIDNIDFKNIDFAFFAAGSEVSKTYAEGIASEGCIVIDKSSYFRNNKNVPLIVPEVNADCLKDHQNIIASPNCSVIPLMVALKPLHDVATIKRLVVSTYQSVSGAGKKAMDELYNQTKGIFTHQPVEPKSMPKRIAFNVIPHIGEFTASGMTSEEWKLEMETKKILGRQVEVTATCVRVPVFVGHSAAVNVEFEESISLTEVKKLLKAAPGLEIFDRVEDNIYATPIDVMRDDKVLVSRIRKDHTVDSGVNLWIVADNLRKGAALNSVQIAEYLINE